MQIFITRGLYTCFADSSTVYGVWWLKNTNHTKTRILGLQKN